MSIKIKRIITHDLDLSKDKPIVFDKLMDLKSVPTDAIEFLAGHIESVNINRLIKACKFIRNTASVLSSCQEIWDNQQDDKLFILNTVHMTQVLFQNMQSSSSRSSGSLIFIQYQDRAPNNEYLAILKMDPNKGIEIDRNRNTFIVHKNILPTVREKLHKSAIIKLTSELWNESVHLRVLDKQQASGEVSKFFLNNFLEATPIINNKAMTELVSSTLTEFVLETGIVKPGVDVYRFNAEVDRILQVGKQIDVDRDLENLFESYIPGETDREKVVEQFKGKLVEKREDVHFEFTVEKKPVFLKLTDDSGAITLKFPIRDLGTKVTYEYEEKTNTTVIRMEGVKLFEK